MSLILTLFVLFIIGYIRQGDNKLIYESLKKDSYNYHQIYSINLEQMNTDNITVSDTLSVLKENGENILVSEILNTGDKFVIRFNDAGCISCMQYFKKHIDYINMFISEVGAQNVICLLNSNNPRIIRSFKKQYCIVNCESTIVCKREVILGIFHICKIRLYNRVFVTGCSTDIIFLNCFLTNAGEDMMRSISVFFLITGRSAKIYSFSLLFTNSKTGSSAILNDLYVFVDTAGRIELFSCCNVSNFSVILSNTCSLFSNQSMDHIRIIFQCSMFNTPG